MTINDTSDLIAAIDHKIAVLQKARASITEAVALLGDAVAPAVPEPAVSTTEPKPPKVAKAAPARPTRASSTEHEAAVLAALKAGPLSPAELQARVNLDRLPCRVVVQSLVSAGKVKVTGNTSTRRVALA